MARQVGEQAISAGIMPSDDVESEEPYLYLGLTSLTMLEAAIRSMALPVGFQLSDGMLLTPEQCPADFAELFQVLMEAKRLLIAAEFSPEEMNVLRRVALFTETRRCAAQSLLSHMYRLLLWPDSICPLGWRWTLLS